MDGETAETERRRDRSVMRLNLPASVAAVALWQTK